MYVLWVTSRRTEEAKIRLDEAFSSVYIHFTCPSKSGTKQHSCYQGRLHNETNIVAKLNNIWDIGRHFLLDPFFVIRYYNYRLKLTGDHRRQTVPLEYTSRCSLQPKHLCTRQGPRSGEAHFVIGLLKVNKMISFRATLNQKMGKYPARQQTFNCPTTEAHKVRRY